MKLRVFGVVYSITCDPTGEQYVGRSFDGDDRWRMHLCRLRHHRHPNDLLQAAFDTHGEAAFHFSVLEELLSRAWLSSSWDLEESERYWIRALMPAFNKNLKRVS
jgi:group I intron endonuclease